MKSLKFLSVVFIATLILGGCTYNFLVPEEIPVIDPEDPEAPQISFATQIQPIFTNSCASCHKTGGTSPDLTEGNAYASITKYINTSTPEESAIYTHPSPTTDTHKQKKYTAVEAALLLGWIQQGAKNN